MPVTEPSLDVPSMPLSQEQGSGAAPDSLALILAAQAGDFLAFERLVERYHGRLFRMVRVMVGQDCDAEEIMQDALLAAYQGLKRAHFAHSNARMVRAWLFRIAVNAALMHQRRLRRNPTLSLDELPEFYQQEMLPAELSLWQRAPDEIVSNRELGLQLERALRQLPDRYRLVLWLRDVEDQTNDEVAETLGLTVPTVKARLHRARLAVRAALSDAVGKRRRGRAANRS